MKLYHFTSPHHVEGCTSKGISLGCIPTRILPPQFVFGFQWLTANPEYKQSWNEGSSLPYDRTTYRLTVEVPEEYEHNVVQWNKIGIFLTPLYNTLSATADHINWYLYRGKIPPEWITLVEAKMQTLV